MNEAFYRVLRARFPDAPEAKLWRTVAMLIAALANVHGVDLDTDTRTGSTDDDDHPGPQHRGRGRRQ